MVNFLVTPISDEKIGIWDEMSDLDVYGQQKPSAAGVLASMLNELYKCSESASVGTGTGRPVNNGAGKAWRGGAGLNFFETGRPVNTNGAGRPVKKG